MINKGIGLTLLRVGRRKIKYHILNVFMRNKNNVMMIETRFIYFFKLFFNSIVLISSNQCFYFSWYSLLKYLWYAMYFFIYMNKKLLITVAPPAHAEKRD